MARGRIVVWGAALGVALGCGDSGTPTTGSSGPTGSSSTVETVGPGTNPTNTTSATGTASTTSATNPTTATTSTTAGTTGTNSTTAGTTGVPPIEGGCDGYATRYWDCCKAHCGWGGNVNPQTEAVPSCDKNDQSHGDNYDVPSSCDALEDASAYTCYSMAPWAVDGTTAYGFAAVPANGDICGRCYQLDFTGESYNAGDDPGCAALAGKSMIVQATNIGFDVGGGQFDILTPGGGVGLFDACSYQWDVDTQELGATYGGFLTACKEGGANTHAAIKECVQGRCEAVFPDSKPELAELRAACEWYVDWFEAADNPSLKFQEVPCPQAIIDVSGVDRGPLDDIEPCDGGGEECTQEIKDQCDCAWTNTGANCGNDDGSCCYEACCE